MKKNFLKVAAMLIAAMLMVVSCTQEIAPVNNELVEARLGLAYGKDVTVTVADGKVITYTYELAPQWSAVNNGTEIYGATKKEEPINNGTTYKLSDPVTDENLGKVTPGLWKITVRGYTEYVDENNKGKLVLFGSNNAYFVNGASAATVIVSPVISEGKGTVEITLEMQDLGNGNDISKNAINCTIHNVTSGNDYAKTINGESVTSIPLERAKSTTKDNVYVYSLNLTDVKAGFNTITFTTPEVAGEGGIVKTFLVIPGNDVEIKGSVYPSEFQTGKATIKVVNMKGASLTVTGAEETDKKIYELTNNKSYIISVNDSALNLNDLELPAGSTEGKTTYTWYVNGSQVKTGTGDSNKSYSFQKSAAGDYTVTCTIQYEFERTDPKTSAKTTYKWIGDASLGNIRVMPASTSATN